MIFCLFDPAGERARIEALRFRSRDSFFWQQKFLSPLPLVSLDEKISPDDFYLVFDLTRLVIPAAGSLEEINAVLKGMDFQETAAFSFNGGAFLGISGHLFSDRKKDRSEGVLSWIAESFPLKKVETVQTYQVVPVLESPLLAEQRIVEFQTRELTASGIWIEDFNHFYLDADIKVGSGTVLGCSVVIKGNSRIGTGVRIYPHCYLENAHIGDDCVLFPGSIVIDSTLERGSQIGPYTHLRQQTVIREGAKAGNFVEMKKSDFGRGSKAMHLSYIGDATIGEAVNIGAGTITCNYDGEKKNPTHIEDHVFIGSGTELVAPVRIHRHSYIAAGSTIVQDVPENSLAVARERQRNIIDWVLRRKKRKES